MTRRSVLSQDAELEVLVSDNASTDRSVAIVQRLERLAAFRCASIRRMSASRATSIRAARMATGDIVNMLSSDDLMRPGALVPYATLFAAIEPTAVVTSSVDADRLRRRAHGRRNSPPDPELWRSEDLVTNLPGPAGARVYRVEASELLRRCLKTVQNPFHFLSTAYPRALYEQIEGYGGRLRHQPGQVVSLAPARGRFACVLRRRSAFCLPLACDQSDAAQQKTSGALEVPGRRVRQRLRGRREAARAGGAMTRDEVERAFVEYDIIPTARVGDAREGRPEEGTAHSLVWNVGVTRRMHQATGSSGRSPGCRGRSFPRGSPWRGYGLRAASARSGSRQGAASSNDLG